MRRKRSMAWPIIAILLLLAGYGEPQAPQPPTTGGSGVISITTATFDAIQAGGACTARASYRVTDADDASQVNWWCPPDGIGPMQSLASSGTGTATVPGIETSSNGPVAFRPDVIELSQNADLCKHIMVTAHTGTLGISLQAPALTDTTCSKWMFISIGTGTGALTILPNGSDTFNENNTSKSTYTAKVGAFWLLNFTTHWQVIETDTITAIGTAQIPVSVAKLPSSPAEVNNAQTNTRALFDASSGECLVWPFIVPADYGGSPSVFLTYSMFSATSGGVSLDISLMAAGSGYATDIDTESYDTANNCDDATVPGTAGLPDFMTCALTTVDSLAAYQYAKLKICRAVSDSADTATGDMEVLAIVLTYTRN